MDVQKLKKFNDGYAYILVCVDAASRMFYAEPVKTKGSQDMLQYRSYTT